MVAGVVISPDLRRTLSRLRALAGAAKAPIQVIYRL